VPGIENLDQRIARGCDRCSRSYLKIRGLVTGRIETFGGDPVSPMTWIYASLEDRVYKVECSECAAVLFERDDCPGCRGKGGLQRALEGQHGLSPLKACPRCQFEELTLTVEARMRVETILGRISRRVCEAESHEGGFHVVEAFCKSCDATVAQSGDAKCVMCGRSRLLRRIT
jgi:hypothetical protein